VTLPDLLLPAVNLTAQVLSRNNSRSSSALHIAARKLIIAATCRTEAHILSAFRQKYRRNHNTHETNILTRTTNLISQLYNKG
jgi:hypothetical protein